MLTAIILNARGGNMKCSTSAQLLLCHLGAQEGSNRSPASVSLSGLILTTTCSQQGLISCIQAAICARSVIFYVDHAHMHPWEHPLLGKEAP